MNISLNRPRPVAFSIPIMLLASGVLTGCTMSNIHNNKSIAEISSLEQAQAVVKLGMSMSEVRSRLGEPGFANTFNNTIMWTYQSRITRLNSGKKTASFVLTGYSPADTKMVTVHFNASNTVDRVEYNEQRF